MIPAVEKDYSALPAVVIVFIVAKYDYVHPTLNQGRGLKKIS